MPSNRTDHIRLTSHPVPGGKTRFSDPLGSGDCAPARAGHRHGVAAAATQRHRRPWRLLRALPCACGIGARARPDPPPRPHQHPSGRRRRGPPFSQWSEPGRIVSLDPWGHVAAEEFQREIQEGEDIRPTIAVTRARLDLVEMRDAVRAGRLKPDGRHVLDTGECHPRIVSRALASGTRLQRLKSLLALGHLKKFHPQGAHAWLQGKILVAVLVECMIAFAERFSPWGYAIGADTPALPVAGDFHDAAPA